MVCVIFGFICAGLHQNYSLDGVRIMVLFSMCNFYVIMLQILWQFKANEKYSTKKDVEKTDGSFERVKDKLGLYYFDNDTEIEFSNSQLEKKKIEKVQVEKNPYMEFVDNSQEKVNENNDNESEYELRAQKSFNDSEVLEDDDDFEIRLKKGDSKEIWK